MRKRAFYFVALILVTLAVTLSIVVRTHAANGLIGAWALDEGSGAVAADASGNGNQGTIVRGTGTGSPAWVASGHDASMPYALDFDGTGAPGSASNSVNLGNSPLLDQMDNYTISLWVKFKAGYVGGGGAWANLVGRNSSGVNWAWMIYVNSAGTIRPHHRNSNGSFAPLTNSATVMPVGQWVHIEQVADGSRLHLYINGQEDPNFPVSYSGTTMSLPTANTYIGQDTREYAPKATISDVKIYNTAAKAPRVGTSPATNITQASAKLNGTLSSLGDYSSAKVFFRYRLAGSGDPYTETTPQSKTATGSFNATPSNLVAATQYEFLPVVQWQGRDGLQEVAGTSQTFTTLPYTVQVNVTDNLTSESGDAGSFTLCLNARPSAPVIIALSSSNTDEGSVPSSITIQPDDWNNCAANTVVVTGVDDTPPTGDGSVPYTIVTGDVTSTDPGFDALTASDVSDVSVENQNNDPPAVVVSLVNNDNQTGEDGAAVHARFQLLSMPSANVTIPISLSDTSEGTLGGVTSMTITPANWNQPQNNDVVITGVDDQLADGTVAYSLVTGDPTSADAGYEALASSDISDPALFNTDNDTAHVTIAQSDDSTAVVEGGASDSFTIVPDTQPASGKTIVIKVQPDTQVDLGSGAGVAVLLTFNDSNWSTPQTVTVAADDDSTIEGDHTGSITLSVDPSTTESTYDSVDPDDISVQITDNDDDNDTVSAAIENAAPNGGDANNDGVRDSAQPNVTSFVNPVTGKYVTLAVDDACSVTAIGSDAVPVDGDQEYMYPFGLLSYTVDCGSSGYRTHVKVYYHDLANTTGLTARKHNSVANTYATLSSATISGSNPVTVAYDITDGSSLDEDGTQDGSITDPIGLGIPRPSVGAPNTGFGSKKVQAMAGAGMIIGIGLLGVGILIIRRAATRS